MRKHGIFFLQKIPTLDVYMDYINTNGLQDDNSKKISSFGKFSQRLTQIRKKKKEIYMVSFLP